MRVLTIASLLVAAASTAAFGLSPIHSSSVAETTSSAATSGVDRTAALRRLFEAEAEWAASHPELVGDDDSVVIDGSSSLAGGLGNASGYDPRLAMDALYYSKSTYCAEDQVSRWTCLSCGFTPAMREVEAFTLRETLAYVGYNAARDHIVIAVRGSANAMNWLDDFTFELVPFPYCDVPYNSSATSNGGVRGWAGGGCKVHKGFYEIYKALSVRMLPAVKQLMAKYPSAALFATGHSMGAAVATLAAVALHGETRAREVHVYHFGGPRVGDGAFAQYASLALTPYTTSSSEKEAEPLRRLGGLQYRITHRMDPVPHLPLRSMGYVHTVREIFYDNGGNTTWTVCNDTTVREDQKCANKYLIPIDMSDHMRYLGIYSGCGMTADALAARPYHAPAGFTMGASSRRSEE